jgi:XTP/dITP diphosphohydrolase
MTRRSLIIATGNLHKVEEFEQLLAGSPFTVQSTEICGGMPEVDETGTTFAENAYLKAKALHRLAPEGASVLADDSGLEVDALDGEPGVYSARYAGADASDRDNIAKLLKALEGVSVEARTARFKCALCFIDHKGSVVYYEGSCEGHIAALVSGESGFGYDPIFIPDGYQQSFAELGSAVKSQLSHRASAVRALDSAYTDGS